MPARIDEPPGIRRAHSAAPKALDAVAEFHAAVIQADMALVVFFCSSDYELDLLAAEMQRLFGEVQVIGCTTAGEIGPAGYLEHSLCGASFPASQFTAVCGCIEDLQGFTLPAGQGFARELLRRHQDAAPNDQSFALLLIDGLSVREEPVTRAVQSALARIPLIGGSAGDGADFRQTHLYFEGRFRSDRAILALLSTRLPLTLFQTQHFVATDERLVVTEADPARRVVHEINGRPAAVEYARAVGVGVSALSSEIFSARPVVVLINGESYVRSIQKANPDHSLTFYCAIEDGLILRIAQAADLLQNLRDTFAAVRSEIGPPQLTLACDCHFRRIEVFQSPDKNSVIDLMLQNKSVGFSTYGEQFRGVHINQTLTGVAIGYPAAHDDV